AQLAQPDPAATRADELEVGREFAGLDPPVPDGAAHVLEEVLELEVIEVVFVDVRGFRSCREALGGGRRGGHGGRPPGRRGSNATGRRTIRYAPGFRM